MDTINTTETDAFISPVSKKRLFLSSDGNHLITKDGLESFDIIKRQDVSIPILLTDKDVMALYAKTSNTMNKEYSILFLKLSNSIPMRLLYAIFRAKYATKLFNEARNLFFNKLNDSKLSISIGGGPDRTHPKLVNLNIAPFANVDVVADAHFLPYADNSIDAIYCAAVFEHLYDPQKAASEMNRVLRPGGIVFSETPFLQAFHGYPHHYHNFTLTGHEELFKSNNFSVLNSGVGNGPCYMLTNLIGMFIKEYFPPILNIIFRFAWFILASLFLKPFDYFLNNITNSHYLANSTFILAKKND